MHSTPSVPTERRARCSLQAGSDRIRTGACRRGRRPRRGRGLAAEPDHHAPRLNEPVERFNESIWNGSHVYRRSWSGAQLVDQGSADTTGIKAMAAVAARDLACPLVELIFACGWSRCQPPDDGAAEHRRCTGGHRGAHRDRGCTSGGRRHDRHRPHFRHRLLAITAMAKRASTTPAISTLPENQNSLLSGQRTVC